MESPGSHEMWKKEVEYLEDLKKRHPDSFLPPKHSGKEVLEETGVYIFKDLPPGYIKVLPYDFVVEEITSDGELLKVDGESMETVDSPTGFVHATLVKIGIPSMDAVREIAKELGIGGKDVTYAGLKDGGALTSQELSFNKIKKEDLQNLKLPLMSFENICIKKGLLSPGSLTGNRFTILVRSEVPYHEDTFMQRVEEVKKNGIYNFYGPQRFGAPRYISHFFGHALVRGDFKETVRMFLCKISPFEYPYFTNIRNKALEIYGNWQEMIEIYKELPNTFRLEIKILESLIKHSEDPEKYKYYNALKEVVADQVDFWVKSYSSFLFNEYISEAVINGLVLPKTLPLLAGGDEDAVKQFYGKALVRDGVTDFAYNISKIREVRTGNNVKVETKIQPIIHNALIIPEGFLFSFDLPKGAYATTLIGSLVSIEHGEQFIKHVKPEFVDTKKILGTGSLEKRYKEWKEFSRNLK